MTHRRFIAGVPGGQRKGKFDAESHGEAGLGASQERIRSGPGVHWPPAYVLLKAIEEGRIHPDAIITSRVSLAGAPEAYKTFNDEEEERVKVVVKP